MLLNEPIENWPVVDVFVCFYSNNFPMDKAIEYVKLTKPYEINELEPQKILWDRRKIYRILKENGIPMAKHFFVERSD